jgi:hypothetical protein
MVATLALKRHIIEIIASVVAKFMASYHLSRLFSSMASFVLLTGLLPSIALAQVNKPPAANPTTLSTASSLEASYLSLARAYTAAPVVARVSVRSTGRVPRDTPPPPPGRVQTLVTVDVQTVLKSRDPVPARLSYIYETQADSRGRAPDLRKQVFLVFLEPVGSFDGAYRLVGSNPQRVWSQSAEDRLRAIGQELLTPQGAGYSVQALRGIIDLDLASGPALGFIIAQKNSTPLTLIVQNIKGVSQIRVSLSDTDLEGAPIAAESILMYQLVCFLPRTLPEELLQDYVGQDSIQQGSAQKAQRQAAARTAWASLTQQLGTCPL